MLVGVAKSIKSAAARSRRVTAKQFGQGIAGTIYPISALQFAPSIGGDKRFC